jgi:hypothetical protein
MEGTMTESEKITDRSTIIYLILSTLSESADGMAPESFIYLPLSQKLSIHLDQFTNIVGIAIAIGWLERRPGPVLCLTDEGRKIVQTVEASLKVQP